MGGHPRSVVQLYPLLINRAYLDVPQLRGPYGDP
jgi:hypothetical protein